MSEQHNNRSQGNPPDPETYFFVGQKGFNWSLCFMATGTPAHMIVRGRIVLHGTPEVYIDSNEITVDTTVLVIPPPMLTVTFNTADRVEVDSSEFTTQNNYRGNILADDLIQLHFQLTPGNEGYAIQIHNLDLTVKWVVGARHIVIVDPAFPRMNNTAFVGNATANN